MVDFNNEATIGTPAANIVKILLLQARANVIEALEVYNKKLTEGIDIGQSVVRARIGTWFLEHQAYLERSLKPKEYQTLLERFKTNFFFNEKDIDNKIILDTIIELNKVLDQLRITRVDLKRQYDKTDIEEDNKQNDLQ